MKMKIFGKTDVGVVRDNNQDTFRIVTENGLSLCIVCDGMGGAAGGSTASNTACDAFVKKVFDSMAEKTSDSNLSDILINAVKYANNCVYTLAKEKKELSGMGTTLCAVVTDGKKMWAVSVGDSRIYMYEQNEIHQISHDHSYVQALIDCGAITKEEGRFHPQKNIITRAVGTSSDVDCDSYTLEQMPDGILICSDGLTNYVNEDELKEVFGQCADNTELIAATLIDKANAAGGGDNITVLVMLSNKQ